MTEGRFETVHNLRPTNWDHRRHWTNWHHLYDCEDDHLARESCPFHDLRAGGCFQYESHSGGAFNMPARPDHLNDRLNGDRMDFSRGRGTNLGGMGNIPLDTDPGRPTQSSIVDRRRAVFTKKNPLNRGLFSTHTYMPEGAAYRNGADTDVRRLSAHRRVGMMKAGGPVNYLGMPSEYILDPFNDKIDRGRVGHFRTGGVRHDNPSWMPEGSPRTRKLKKHGPFLAGKPNGFTFGGNPEWIPDPYHCGGLKNDRRPFRTWHTRTKQSMPTHVPWSTGLQTAEPKKGSSLDLTDRNVPSMRNDRRTKLTPTVGPEAALLGLPQIK